jgi:hypothetical protein
MKLAVIGAATLVALSGANAYARDKPVKHRPVVAKQAAKPGRAGEQRTLPSYGNPMPARRAVAPTGRYLEASGLMPRPIAN